MIMVVITVQRLLISSLVMLFTLRTFQAKQMLICDEEDDTLFCEKGVINVTRSTFGRTKRWQCGYSYSLRGCKLLDVLDIVTEKCNGKRECHIYADIAVFGNPCSSIFKTEYLNITYHCVGKETPKPSTPTTTTPTTTTILTTQILRKTTTEETSEPSLTETTSKEANLSESDIEGLSDQSAQETLGSATGPIIGLASGVLLIIVIVAITLRQKRKRRKYIYKKRVGATSFLNETYSSSIYNPRSSKTSVKSNRCLSRRNIAEAKPSRPFLENQTQLTCSDYALAKNIESDNCSEVALVHDSKLYSCADKNKSKKRKNDYIYTPVKGTINNEGAIGYTGLDAARSKDGNFLKKTESPDSKYQSRKIAEKSYLDDKNNRDIQCDSSYLDMSMKDGKMKDTDIKYMTMNRNAKPLDDVSNHLYVNDINSSPYCNIQIQNEDKSPRETLEINHNDDVFYDNVQRNRQCAVEDSVYEPYNVG